MRNHEALFCADQFHAMFYMHCAIIAITCLAYLLCSYSSGLTVVPSLIDASHMPVLYVLPIRAVVHFAYADRVKAYRHMHVVHCLVVLAPRLAKIALHAAAAAGQAWAREVVRTRMLRPEGMGSVGSDAVPFLVDTSSGAFLIDHFAQAELNHTLKRDPGRVPTHEQPAA